MKTRKNLNVWLAMSMFLLMVVPAVAAGPTIYVDANAPGANDGSSWADAYNYLQEALAAASSGDEIWVAQGVYKPDRGADVTPGDRTASFGLKCGLIVSGGYAGFGEPDPNERDIELYETILSGDLYGNDGPDFANNGENSYHVVTGSGTDETAILDGFTITAGNANGSSPHFFGGGLYNMSGDPTVVNCTFSGNSASWGGGMSNEESSPMLTNCTFSNNSARILGIPPGGVGGGMYNISSNPVLTNCTFSSNSAVWGGGIDNYHSNPTLTNCTFIGNTSGRNGGGMYNYGGRPTLTNCTFSGNSARKGGGVWNGYSSPTLTNCTFAGNLAPYGNALACDSSDRPSNLQLSNCILWDGGDEIWNNDNSIITITYSNVQGGWLGDGNINTDPCFVEPGYWANANDPNIPAEPDDPNAIWVEGDYHLLPDSPCINAGDPDYIAEPNETDLDGRPRVIGGRIDMGAYEYSPPIPAEVRIVPRSINLASMGKWITCYIWLPEDYTVADIDPNSVFLEDEIQAESLRVDEQQQVATAKFSRSEVQSALGRLEPGDVELTVSCELSDGTRFEGTDTIRVIDKGKKK